MKKEKKKNLKKKASKSEEDDERGILIGLGGETNSKYSIMSIMSNQPKKCQNV